jgi:hypothetical protein
MRQRCVALYMRGLLLFAAGYVAALCGCGSKVSSVRHAVWCAACGVACGMC